MESEAAESRASWWRGHRWLLWLLVPPVLAVASGRTRAGVPDALGCRATRVTIFDAWVSGTCFWLAVVAAIGLAVAGRLWPRLFPRPAWALATLLFVLPSQFVLTWLFAPPWRATDCVLGSDGREYAEVRFGFLQMSGSGIARLTTNGVAWRTFDVLACTSSGLPEYYAAVVRPAESPQAQRVFSTNGLCVGVASGEGYDAGGSAYVAASLDGSRVLEPDDVLRLSPFVLLDSSTPGREADVDAIVDRLKRLRTGTTEPRALFLLVHPGAERPGRDPDDGRSGLPTEACLLTALDSPNPWIRSAARRIVEAGGADMYPEATRRLASAPR